MNKFLKICALTLSAAMVMGLAACDKTLSETTGGTDPASPPADTLFIAGGGASDYVIVRSDLSLNDDEDVKAALALKKAISAATGVEIEINTDWVKDGEIPAGTKEILIGDTNRPESAPAVEGMGEDEYVIKLVGNRLVINGTSKTAIALGVSDFIEKYLGYDSEAGTYAVSSLSLPAGLSETGAYSLQVARRESAVLSYSPEKYATPEFSLIDGVYVQKYDAWELSGCLTSMQVASSYNDSNAVNCDSVMIYSTSENLVKSWTDKEDVYNIDMMTAINRASLEYADAHPESVQTTKSGEKLLHGSGGSYYMVPTLDFIEYIWDQVEWSILKFNPVTIAFEEPEMWNSSGYSQGFKDEWKLYFNEEWQDPQSTPEAMLKSMELKTYLFERIIKEMSARIKKLAPDTSIYIATHSTVSYNAWGITAGLNHYMATGTVDGVIGQTWSDTIRTAYMYKGAGVVDEFLNAYIDFASYVDSVEGANFYALADPMCDSTTSTEDKNRFAYLQTIAASLMLPQIHRFEICPWLNRAFGAVSGSYRTILQQCFNALNEVGGKPITLETGTPGVAYALSDTVSWLKNNKWSPATSDGVYGITMPLATAGIPVAIKSMEQIYTAADLAEVKVLILSYDNMLPMSETVNDAVAEWVKAGGELLLLSGKNEYWSADDRFWKNDGSPVANLLKKLGIEGISVNTDYEPSVTEPFNFGFTTASGLLDTASSCKLVKAQSRFAVSFTGAANPILTLGDDVLGFEESAGKGRVIAVGLPSTFYGASSGGCALLKALTEYALNGTGLEYVETNLMTIRRGNVVATHALVKNDTLAGTYIDIYNENLTVVTDPAVKAKDSRLLYDVAHFDLSVPRFGFSGGELVEGTLDEQKDKTSFSYTSASNSTVSTRLLAPAGSYPAAISAVYGDVSIEPVWVWNNATSSLLLMLEGNAAPTDVTVTWGATPVEDGQNIYYMEDSVEVNDKNKDKKYLISNTAQANSGLRYCDLEGELVYKFDISSMPGVKYSFTLAQNYIAEISADGENWTLIADYSQGGTVEHIRNADNVTILNIYPNNYGITGDFYFRLRNSDVTMGWGGTLNRIMWRYPVTKEQAEAENPPETEVGKVDDSAYKISEENGVASYKRKVLTNNKNLDSDYLLINSASENDGLRFCDGVGQLVYYFNLAGASGFEIEMQVHQNYIIEVSPDNDNWTMVADYSEGGTVEHITTGNNKAKIKIKAADYNLDGKELYIRIRNTDTSMGWGGSITQFTITYTRP